VAHAVRACDDLKIDLAEMSLEQLRAFSPLVGEDVFAVLTLEGSVAARDHVGGTAPNQVRAAIARVRQQLAG
jgi:argininosuccinate lyase